MLSVNGTCDIHIMRVHYTAHVTNFDVCTLVPIESANQLTLSSLILPHWLKLLGHLALADTLEGHRRAL